MLAGPGQGATPCSGFPGAGGPGPGCGCTDMVCVTVRVMSEVVGVFHFLDKQGSGRKRLLSGADGRLFHSTEMLSKEVLCKFRKGPFLMSSPTLGAFCRLGKSHADRVCGSHWFWLPFPGVSGIRSFSCASWPSVCLPQRNVFRSISKLDCLGFCCCVI